MGEDMGEDFLKGDLFFIDRETGETSKIAEISELEVQELEVPKLAPGGIKGKTEFADVGEFKGTISIPVKTITKKRAIKLIMGWGYQRNEAYKIHELYMQTCKIRTLFDLAVFCMIFAGIKKLK